MKPQKLSLLLTLLFISLCPNPAKATTIVEKIFPCLTLVTDASTISKDKTYVLVADDGENMYAVTDELKEKKLASIALSVNTDIRSQNIFFGIKYNTSEKGYELKGLTTKLTYGYVNTRKTTDVVESTSSTYGYLQIDLASDYYNHALLIKAGSDRWLTSNGKTSKHSLFAFYTGYIYRTDEDKSNYLPALIYEYDASKAATSIGTISIKTAEGYGTYYLDLDYEMPKGVTGYTVTRAESGKLTLEKVYDSGETVPANTALIVYGEQGEYSVFAPNETASASMRTTRADVGTKYLYGTVVSKETPRPDESKYYYFYKLCYLTDTDNNKTLGFYWGKEGGAAFLNTAKRAYMAIEQTTASRVMGFAFPETEPTAIENPTQAVAPHPHGIYTLTGAKLNVSDPGQLPHGIFIVDGRKICK